MIERNVTEAWRLYEEGRNYNESLTPNQYNLVETNVEFFIGNQWLRLPDTPAMRGLPKPVFNILKRVASLFVASLTSSGVAMRYEPLAYYDRRSQTDPDQDAAEFLNAAVSNLLEKVKFDYRVRDALFDGAQTGDYCAHFYFDPEAIPYGGGTAGQHRGEIRMELVDGINVMFGNPADRRVQTQPYILLVGRAPVEELRAEAEQFKRNRKRYRTGTGNGDKTELETSLQPDAENDRILGVGGKVELVADDKTGKALYVLMYSKVTREETVRDANGEPEYEDVYDSKGDPVYEKDDKGDPIYDDLGEPVRKRRARKERVTTVYATKATRTGVIYSDVDTGLSVYPVAWGNWEKQKNQYHGRALVTGLIPNQIFINTMFATAMRHMQLMAFPKTVYNADLISRWTNEIGEAVAIHGIQPGQSVAQMVTTLQPAEMSNQIFTLIDKVMAYTKECLGATDAQMGNVKPDNTSALMVLQTNSEVPLENIRSGLYEWVEDCGAIIPDMMATYYGVRPIVVEREFEEIVSDGAGAPQIDPITGLMRTQKVRRKVEQEYDFGQLKHVTLDMRIDVGATTYYSEIAMTQTLDNLRKDGTLDVIQYLERIPDRLIPKKKELISELRRRIAEGAQANAAAGAAIPEPGSPVSASSGTGGDASPIQGGTLSPDLALQGLPTQMETQFEGLPNIAKKTALAQGAMLVE